MLVSGSLAGVSAWVLGMVSLWAVGPGELALPVGAGVLDLTPDLVVSVVAGAIALALEIVPGLKGRWQSLPAELKRFAWLLGCALVKWTSPGRSAVIEARDVLEEIDEGGF